MYEFYCKVFANSVVSVDNQRRVQYLRDIVYLYSVPGYLVRLYNVVFGVKHRICGLDAKDPVLA